MNATIQKIIDEQKKKLAANSNLVSDDKKCPFTGSIKLRGKIFEGIVVSKDTHRTAQVMWTSRRFIKKYERSMDRRTKVAAHNPAVINASIGDTVVIAECRPISKTKRFVIIENKGKSTTYMVKRESVEEDEKIASKLKSKDTENSNEAEE